MSNVRRLGLALFTLAVAFGGTACTRSDTVSDAKRPTTTKLAERPTSLREKLATRRHEQIARLHAYAEAGIFPRNLESPVPLHQLKDPDGRLCAVANLVVLDGKRDVIDAMSIDRNDVLIGEETSGPLHEWVLSSGLTAEEVARIQAPAPYMPNAQLEDASNVALQAHFFAVEQELVAGESASLDVAVARLGGSGTSAGAVATKE